MNEKTFNTYKAELEAMSQEQYKAIMNKSRPPDTDERVCPLSEDLIDLERCCPLKSFCPAHKIEPTKTKTYSSTSEGIEEEIAMPARHR